MATSKQRREAERRRLQRQAQRRAQRDRARRRNTVIASVIGVLAVVGLVIGLIAATSGDDDKQAASAPSTAASTTAAPSSSASSSAATYPCSWTKSGQAAKKASVPSSTKPPKTGKVDVSVRTTRGSMTFALDRSLAPCTVVSFVSLVKQGYYDNSPCHRLTTQGIYVLQCGDPTGTGSGNPGYSIPDEATGSENYPAGTIAMARSQSPHSGGSQFFIVYKDSPNLKQNLGQLQYTVFGKVGSGLDVVTSVAKAGAATGTDGKPKKSIALTTVSVPK